jgi:hypothetical protein
MISYPVYKILHFSGIFLILISLGAQSFHALSEPGSPAKWRKKAAIAHGVGMLLALVGGFGLLARLGIHWPWPAWVVGKLLIWLTLGALMAPVRRGAGFARSLWWVIVILGALAAGLALYKP